MTWSKGQLLLAALAALLLGLKLAAPGEIAQIPAELLLKRLGDQAAAHGAGPIMIGRRRDLAGVPQMTLTLPGCTGTIRVVAVSTQEDLSSAIRIGTPPDLPASTATVFAQGQEYGVGGRFGMRLAAVGKYLALKFGLTDIAPSGTLLAVIRDPACQAYQALDWPGLWSVKGWEVN